VLLGGLAKCRFAVADDHSGEVEIRVHLELLWLEFTADRSLR
jgi:hypothetical protein